ncbi:MAG: hypothetical protein L0Y70_14715 [Gemmataceae bacterium]|nr:hypothetical protein [Gemmataceae bacterium]
MTVTLTLPADLERRLSQEASDRGLPIDQYLLEVLQQHAPPVDKAKKLSEAIESWIQDDDPEEQRETQEYLIRVLDEDRLSARKLFPPEMKGKTW